MADTDNFNGRKKNHPRSSLQPNWTQLSTIFVLVKLIGRWGGAGDQNSLQPNLLQAKASVLMYTVSHLQQAIIFREFSSL